MTLRITRPNPTDRRGFTLVELLLVVIILGVIVSMSVPRFSNSFDFMKLRSGTYDFAATLEHAQALSILQERFIRLEISPDGDSCRVESDRETADQTPIAPLRYELPADVRVGAVTFDDPFLSGRRYITFRPDGEADRCTLRVGNSAGDAFEIYVLGGLGRIRILRVEGDERT